MLSSFEDILGIDISKPYPCLGNLNEFSPMYLIWYFFHIIFYHYGISYDLLSYISYGTSLVCVT